MIPNLNEWSWAGTPLLILVIVIVAVIGRWLLLRAIRRASDLAVDRAKRRRQAQGASTEPEYLERYAARAATMGSLLRSLTNAAILILTILTILATLGVPLAPLLASAGVGGVALGFGAQSLVKDYLSGIFMIVEDQYGVGDLVDLGEAIGTVEDVGLRVTRLRDGNGQVWYIRNGEIVRVGNQTQGWSTAIADIPVDPNEDAARVIRVLGTAADEIYADPDWESALLEKPNVVGVQSVDAGRMTIRVVAKTVPNQNGAVQREILDRGLQVLKEAGIKGPRVLPAPPTL